ncbi:helix-turn-helix domain-containing protein [Lacticaseibacillus mingshuiensis]|uniref:Helix-turn-helix domain-containing protein n=1 Tax=Lacticaseibacillus mingshuiensis TaxID=2799574 RepID=A0ABW4CJS2_9LACO|nr:helix-turn-helix transcriptional regulator [Lacticaseibacillus mingshuiensis]
MNTFGSTLENWRQARGIPAKDLARQIGISTATYHRSVHDSSSVRLDDAVNALNALRYSFSDLQETLPPETLPLQAALSDTEHLVVDVMQVYYRTQKKQLRRLQKQISALQEQGAASGNSGFTLLADFLTLFQSELAQDLTATENAAEHLYQKISQQDLLTSFEQQLLLASAVYLPFERVQAIFSHMLNAPGEPTDTGRGQVATLYRQFLQSAIHTRRRAAVLEACNQIESREAGHADYAFSSLKLLCRPIRLYLNDRRELATRLFRELQRDCLTITGNPNHALNQGIAMVWLDLVTFDPKEEA